jgi:4a-hydroxytetrahydrobiopterin dehydratase
MCDPRNRDGVHDNDGNDFSETKGKNMTQEWQELAAGQCVPCRGGVAPLTGEPLEALFRRLNSGWSLVEEHHLEKEYRFKSFSEALAFVNRVGAIAEEQNHHPDIELGWGRVKVIIYTHKIKGLTESDFIFAAKTEKAYQACRAETSPNS